VEDPDGHLAGLEFSFSSRKKTRPLKEWKEADLDAGHDVLSGDNRMHDLRTKKRGGDISGHSQDNKGNE
jgi:hypothetical protein